MEYFLDHNSFLNYADLYDEDFYDLSYNEYETYTFEGYGFSKKRNTLVTPISSIKIRGVKSDYIKKLYSGETLISITEVYGEYKYVCTYGYDYPGIPVKSQWFINNTSYREHGPHTIYYYVPFSVVEFTREDYESGIDLYDENIFTRVCKEDYTDFGESNPLTIFYYLNGNIQKEYFSNHKYIEYNYDGTLKCISHRIPYKCDHLPRYWNDEI